MSRQAHLPPRCPIQKKPMSVSIHDSVSRPLYMDESFPRHHKSSSQSSILEEPPAWLDDLLSDPDSNSKGLYHRRSVNDSVALLDALVDAFPSLALHKDDENSADGLEAACTYGPNSPRQKSNLTFVENAIVSALSKSVSQDATHYAVENLHIADWKGDDCYSVGDLNADKKAVKGHSGQRSRVRKLQYIAELERTVDALQTFESGLAVRVAALLQQRASLSMENCKLKQQIAILQQEKLIMERQYLSLKKQLERLKISFAKSPNNKTGTYFGSGPAADTTRAGATWQMLEMGKLNIS